MGACVEVGGDNMKCNHEHYGRRCAKVIDVDGFHAGDHDDGLGWRWRQTQFEQAWWIRTLKQLMK